MIGDVRKENFATHLWRPVRNWEGGRIRSNQELRELSPEPTLSEVKAARLRWYGHGPCKEDGPKRIAKRTLGYSNLGTRTLGRSSARWKYEVQDSMRREGIRTMEWRPRSLDIRRAEEEDDFCGDRIPVLLVSCYLFQEGKNKMKLVFSHRIR